MATQTSIFMEKEELKEGLIESQIQINFPRLIAWAISCWEHNIEGAVSCSCWLITEVNTKVEVKNQEEEEDVLICGTEHLWPSKREEAWMSDCKTDQNAITTCFEYLFMSCLRGLADLLPAKCNRYINKRQESSANGSLNWEATSCHEVILLRAEIAPRDGGTPVNNRQHVH